MQTLVHLPAFCDWLSKQYRSNSIYGASLREALTTFTEQYWTSFTGDEQLVGATNGFDVSANNSGWKPVATHLEADSGEFL
jgi:hypothetical protein